ncbi:unnamed protein product, partial [marine sediment metagenome]
MHVYLIKNLIDGKQYVGAKKGNNSEYFGSGKLIGEAIEKFGRENFKKEVLVEERYIDDWEECLRFESACILSLNTLQPNGYNILFWNWPFPVEICSEGGKIGGKIAGKITGKKTFEKKKGLFDPANEKKVREGNTKGAKRLNELYPGIGAKRCRELGRGWFAPGMQSKAGKIGGKRTHELYPEEQKRWGKI